LPFKRIFDLIFKLGDDFQYRGGDVLIGVEKFASVGQLLLERVACDFGQESRFKGLVFVDNIGVCL